MVHVYNEGNGSRHGEAYVPFDPKYREQARGIAAETVRRLGGHVQYFQAGGVTGDIQGLNPEFFRRLGLWSQNVGQVFNVLSGFRSMEEQRILYQKYLAGTGNLAAPPGSSNHEFGVAADGPHWGSRGPGQFGLHYNVSGEPWHVEPVEGRSLAGDGTPGGLGITNIVPLPMPPMVDKLGKVGKVAEAYMQFVYDKSLAWAGEATLQSSLAELDYQGDPATLAQATRWAQEAIALTGVPQSWLTGILTIARRESNFNPTAVNNWDSNAAAGDPSKGVMQTIGATFNAYKLPGLGDIFNPVHNMVAAIRYILARYSDISNVQQADPNRPPKGYHDGGVVDGVGERVGRLLGGEGVISRRGMAALPAGGFEAINRGDGLPVEQNVTVNVETPVRDPQLLADVTARQIASAVRKL